VVPQIGLLLETGYAQLRLHDIETFTTFFDSAAMLTLDYNFTQMTQLVLNDAPYDGPMLIARNMTGGARTGGEVVSFDRTSIGASRALVASNHANAAPGVVRIAASPAAMSPDFGFAWVETLPSGLGPFVAAVADAVALGDDLMVVGGGAFTVSPLGVGVRVGSALGTKAALAAGSVLTGR
jgi:hypothetical protein